MCNRRLEALAELLCANDGDGHLEQLPLIRAGGVVGCDVGRVGPGTQACHQDITGFSIRFSLSKPATTKIKRCFLFLFF